MSFFGLFGRKDSAEENFWRWYVKNESRLFDFERELNQIFAELGAQIRKVHPSMTFEFGPKLNGRRDFVISADGIKSAFPFVISLADKAPELPRWTIIKFRPRRELWTEVSYEGLTVQSGNAYLKLEPEGEKAAITLFINGYDEDRRKAFLACSFLLLDNALGEYDVETKVGLIEVKSADHLSTRGLTPFSEIRQSFDRFVSAKTN